MITKRKVTFGNPSLGTYGGKVYTYTKTRSSNPNPSSTIRNSDDHNDNDDTINNDELIMLTKMVAITDVPSDQIPEGLLNLAKGYRSSIEHIRVVISGGSCSSISSSKSSLDEQKNNNISSDCNNENDDETNTKEHKKRRYLVLLTFCSSKAADLFVQNLNGKPYNSFERDLIASVHHVAKLENDCDDENNNNNIDNDNGDDNGQGSCTISCTKNRKRSLISPFLVLSDNRKEGTLSILSSEKQNCAVCLEPMEFSASSVDIKVPSAKKESSQSSIFTTVCNHSFHTDCLLQCQDSPCPVCRYDHSGLNETLSQCIVCGTTENIYVCLICGVASCWNRQRQCNQSYSCDSDTDSIKNAISQCAIDCDTRGHAGQHYDETLHAYALDTETQHVWDFAGQGYVHRLIENADDGKIVEVSDPRSGAMERSPIPELSDSQEGEVVHRKLEGYASQYYTLLKSQLEQQRVYYEGVMDEIRRDHRANSRGNSTAELISALKQDRHQLQQRCLVLQKKRDKVSEDLVFLKNMNESLEANKEPMKRQILDLQKQRADAAEVLNRKLSKLKEKVNGLMLELEMD